MEIYFPRYGWVQFEPTASQPAIERPTPEDPSKTGSNADSPLGDPSRVGGHEAEDAGDDPRRNPPANIPGAAQGINISPAGWLIAIGLGMILLVAGGGFIAMGWYENRGTPKQTGGGAWAFARLSRMTRWLRVRQSSADTPYEQAKTIGSVVPKRQGEIDQLANLYVRERSGRAEVDLNQTRSIWQRLHWSLWGAGLKRRLPRWLAASRDWLKRLRHQDRI